MFPLRDKNPNHGTPLMTIFLIVINVAVFFYQISLGRRGMFELKCQPNPAFASLRPLRLKCRPNSHDLVSGD